MIDGKIFLDHSIKNDFKTHLFIYFSFLTNIKLMDKENNYKLTLALYKLN